MAFFGGNLATKKPLLDFVMIFTESAAQTLIPFPVGKKFVEKIKNNRKMLKKNNLTPDILEDTTIEIISVVDDDETAANLVNVGAIEPGETTIDLVSDSSSESKVEVLEVVTSTAAAPGQIYDTWARGLVSTSTPSTSTPSTSTPRAERQIEQLRSLIQVNQEFNNLFDQPDSTWPANLDQRALKKAYSRAYALAEEEYPDLIDGEELPHPSAFDSEPEGPEVEEDVVTAETETGSTTENVTEVSSDKQEGPVGFGSDVAGYDPIPSTSTGKTRPAPTPSWYGPMNKKARQLWSEGYTTEEAIQRILNEYSGDEENRNIAETFIEHLHTQIRRQAGILEVVKNQQKRYEYYLSHGKDLPNPNPSYRGEGFPEEVWHGEFGEDSPEEASAEPDEPATFSSDPSEPGKCSPNNCTCPEGEKCVFWENANYTD